MEYNKEEKKRVALVSQWSGSTSRAEETLVVGGGTVMFPKMNKLPSSSQNGAPLPVV